MSALAQLYETLELPIENCIIEVKGKSDWRKSIPGENQFSWKLLEQINVIQPDGFYHFNGIPLILFFENPEERSIKRIHSQSWCFNQAAVIFIVKEGEVEVYNAFRYLKDKNRLHDLKLGQSKIAEHFSFWEIQSGNTWRWLEDTHYKGGVEKHRVDRYLLNNIRTAVKQLEQIGLPLRLANKLLLRLIFSRYLIDRNVILDEAYIEGEPGDKERRKESFNHLIADRSGIYGFFEYLKKRFNGNLFDIEDDEDQVEQRHLNLLTRLFRGENLETGEQVLFDVYDFGVIPIELVSGIYESIIDEKRRRDNASIYTPTFLVNYVLKHTVEEYLAHHDTSTCKILDPSCGSGIFLVEAYRRMVEKEREKAGGTLGDETLIELLAQNLYGIDKDEDEFALHVAIFSLYVALLDYKEPKDIQNIKLPELLNKRVFRADFFDTDHPFNGILKDVALTFIIGNPPWKSDKSTHHLQYIGKGKDKLPVARYEISQTFLLRVKDFAHSHLKCGLIVTSKAFYNLGARGFKKYFFENFFVDQLFDLSPARRLIFKKADNPAIIVFYRYAAGRNTKDHMVKHYSIKPNLFLKNFNALVIEKYDQEQIRQEYLITYDWLLKVALYGTAIDFEFLKKLRSGIKTFENFIETKKNIYRGDGILKKNTDCESYKDILGIPILGNKDITDYYCHIKDNSVVTLEETYLKSGDNINYYKGQKILLKSRTRTESDIVVSFVEDTAVFKHCTFGIASTEEIFRLKEFYGIIISKLFTYYQFLTSSDWGVFYPELALEEYLSFPYVEIDDKKRFVGLVERFIGYYKDYYEKRAAGSGNLELVPSKPPVPEDLPEFKQINEMVNEAYGVGEMERDLIDYMLEVSRYLFQEKKAFEVALRRVTDEDLRQYADIFYKHFSSIYHAPGEYFQVQYIYLNYFVAMKFMIVSHKPDRGEEIIKLDQETSEEQFLKSLSHNLSIWKITNELYSSKVIKGFEEDFFYIIKPNEFKSWHRAIAHVDLSEFIDDINRAELEQMKDK